MNSLTMKINVKEYEETSKKKDKLKSNDFSLSLFNSRISDKVKSRLYRELKVLLKSGITVEDAIDILIKQSKNKKLVKVLSDIHKELLKGKKMVYAMSKIKVFTSFEVNTLAIGEETNTLTRVLEELEVFFDRKDKLKNQIITVLSYPVFVILITIAVLVFMLRNVVPMFEKVFKQFNSELPELTQKIIYLSNNFSYIAGGSVVVLLIVIVFYYKNKNSNRFRAISSSIILRIPFFGRITKAIYLSRFCRALSLLLTSKVSLIESLDYVKAMIGFYPIESSIDEIKSELIKGNTLGNSLSKYKVYDLNMISMVKVSEEVNELEEMFDYLTNEYTTEVDNKAKRIGALIEPFIIIIIGGLVGVIMISMYLPMFDLSKILNSN